MSVTRVPTKKKAAKDEVTQVKELLANQRRDIINNVTTLRSLTISALTNTERDINQECKYPDIIDILDYKLFYDREGIAARIVNIFPDETWIKDPIIKETPEKEETAFEKAWDEFQEKHMVYHYLHRIDRLSGIGRYGILLFGVNDGKTLDKPLLEPSGETPRELLYLRPLDESVVTIKSTV